MKLLVFILFSSNLYAQNFDYQKEIETQQPASAYTIDLTEDVYRKVKYRYLSDIRISNSSNDLVPMRLINKNDSIDYQVLETSLPLFKINQTTSTRVTTKQIRTKRSGAFEDYTVTTSKSLLNYLKSEEQQLESVYYIDASSLKNKKIYSLDLDWKFKQAGNRVFYVNIQASKDLQHWQTINSKQKLLEITIGNKTVLENRISLNRQNYSYYRLTFDEFPSVQLIKVRAGLLDQSIVNNNEFLQISEVSKQTANEITWETAGFYPIESIKVDFKQKNLITDVKVYSRNRNKDKWRFVRKESLYSLFYEGEELINNNIPINGINHKYWKLVFDENVNNDNIKQVQMSWRPHQIQFMAQGQGPYTLLLGDSKLNVPANKQWFKKLPKEIRGKIFSGKANLTGDIKQHTKMIQKNNTSLFDKNNQKQWMFWGLLTLILIFLIRMASKLLTEVKNKE
jgi:hypothetical protein